MIRRTAIRGPVIVARGSVGDTCGLELGRLIEVWKLKWWICSILFPAGAFYERFLVFAKQEFSAMLSVCDSQDPFVI